MASTRIAGLDGLRAVAIGAVVVLHSGWIGARGGEAGVDLFFVLSGFLITCLLVARPLDRRNLKVFFLHRFFRLMPALLVMLLAVLVAALVLQDPVGEWHVGPDLWLGLGLGASYTTDVGHMLGFVRPAPVLHTWSLAVEEQFYLLWPLVLWAVREPRLRIRVAMWAAVGSALLSLCVALLGGDPKRVAYGFDTRTTAIALGCWLGLLVATQRPIRAPRWLAPVALSAFALVCTVPRHGAVGHSLGATAAAGISLLLVVGVLATPSSPVVALLERQLVRAVGLRAYSLYLWNIPVFHLLVSERMGFGGGALLLVKLAVNVTCAELSYRLVERPVRAWGYAWTARRMGMRDAAGPREVTALAR